MSGELHQISQALGKLQAEAESSRDGRKILHQKFDDLRDVVADLAAAVREGNRNVSTLQAAMNEVKPEVDHWRNLRNRALGGMAVAGLLLSAGGAAAITAIEKFMQGR